jgi:hypothetical protein
MAQGRAEERLSRGGDFRISVITGLDEARALSLESPERVLRLGKPYLEMEQRVRKVLALSLEPAGKN